MPGSGPLTSTCCLIRRRAAPRTSTPGSGSRRPDPSRSRGHIHTDPPCTAAPSRSHSPERRRPARNFLTSKRLILTMRAILRAVALTVAMALAIPSVALASHGQVAILQDDTNLLQNPALTLREMRHLGVEMVRATVRWSSIAPAGNSRHRPSFNATDPNAYPARGWAPYDAVV